MGWENLKILIGKFLGIALIIIGFYYYSKRVIIYDMIRGGSLSCYRKICKFYAS
jgi:hypothetical protein